MFATCPYGVGFRVCARSKVGTAGVSKGTFSTRGIIMARRITGKARRIPASGRETQVDILAIEIGSAVICSRWRCSILALLCGGRCRFGELLERLPGITSKILSGQLQTLQRHGLIARCAKQYGYGYDYELTPTARQLSVFLLRLERWGADYCRREPRAAARLGLAQLVQKWRAAATAIGASCSQLDTSRASEWGASVLVDDWRQRGARSRQVRMA